MKTIFLTGPPGVGKTAVGTSLAATLGLPFVDTDEHVSARVGKAAHAFLREAGEPAFRAVEAEVTDALLREAGPRVIACGGGTLLDRALRFRVLDSSLLVSLGASETALRARLQGGPDRPLLGLAESALPRLLELRRPAYAECHVSIATDDLSVEEVTDAILPWTARHLVAVPLGERSYCVELLVGDPTRPVDRLAALGPSTVIVVTDARIRRALGKHLDAVLAPLTVPRVDVVLAAGEDQKTSATVAAIWDAALGAGIDRDAVVFAFGGGVVLDLAGFAAATLLRGIRWMGCPTTVLSIVDASVGGKTGFDHPGGKNLIGAFHQPSAVVADLSTLSTLSARERRAGLAEAVKVALARDVGLLELMEERAVALAAGDVDALLPVLLRAVEAKARVVRDDEHEHGDRLVLNLGHTVGHALEVMGGFTRWQHGEAVALGLVAELQAAAALGLGDRAIAIRTRTLLERLGLPVTLSRDDLSSALPRMHADKKRRGTHMRLPVVREAGNAVVEQVALARLREALMG